MLYQNILETIGNTPIVKLNNLGKKLNVNIYAKLEYFNPAGSIKDRLAIWLIEDAEKKGLLKPRGTIVEATSGNTGAGLALIANLKGYHCIFVIPDKMSKEKIQLLQLLGAKVIISPTAVNADNPRSCYSVAKKIASKIPGAWYANQYDNLQNSECHYQTTGPEIYKDLPQIDLFVGGVGTGGTICGIAKYLKEKNSKIKILVVDPIGSIIYNYFKTGKYTKPKVYQIEGIGEDFIPKSFNLPLIDDMVQVSDKKAFIMMKKLAVKEGILAGISSGAVLAGTLKYLKKNKKYKNVLMIMADGNSRYVSKITSPQN